MFSKGNKDSNRAGAAAPAPKSTGRNMTRSNTPSILSADLAIVGSIKTKGEVQLDGMVEGDIQAVTVTVGEKASVKGEITAEQITIRGKVVGKLRARQIQLSSTAHIEGDITHSTLAMENGAFFEGQCHHDTDPLSARKQAPTNQQQHAPAPPSSGKPAAARGNVPADSVLGKKG